MKRSSLKRNTPLPRGDSKLARTGRLRPVSRRKAKERRQAEPVVQAMYKRDHRQCALRFLRPETGDCMGPSTPHHLRKQSKERGGWDLDNLLTLCARHNDWVENGDPALAYRLGLVVRDGEDVYQAWDRMVAAGLPVVHPIPDTCCDSYEHSCDEGGAP